MKKYYYLVEVQYLGFRYHGWQKQTGVNTVQRMVERTLNYVLNGADFKILVTGRTDAMVSANQTYFELFVKEKYDESKLMTELNVNLPADIRVLGIKEVGPDFNVIQHPKQKEYLYLFSHGAKNHPYAAPYMCYIRDTLNVSAMMEAAGYFVGRHDFRNYCYKPSEKTIFEREVDVSEVVDNTFFTANFFPKQSYAFRVAGKGFMRHQVRMMMGALIKVGLGEIDPEDIRKSLTEEREPPWNLIAPASGLMLHSVDFDL